MGGKTNTVVIDFANEAEDIQKAFQPYYQRTRLEEETDPDKLHDLKAALDSYQVYSAAQIQELVELYLGGADRVRLFRDLKVTLPYAYVAAAWTGLEIFDATDPTLPVSAAKFTDVYGGTADVEVRGDYAYVADFSEGLVVVDANNLESVELGSSMSRALWASSGGGLWGELGWPGVGAGMKSQGPVPSG